MKIRKLFKGNVVIFICCFLVLFSTGALASYQTNLAYVGQLQDSSGVIDVNEYSVPVVYDWDDDGKKDLLVGQRYDHPTDGRAGYVSFYKNVGTNARPAFDTYSLIQSCSETCNLQVPGFG